MIICQDELANTILMENNTEYLCAHEDLSSNTQEDLHENEKVELIPKNQGDLNDLKQEDYRFRNKYQEGLSPNTQGPNTQEDLSPNTQRGLK